jgi:3-hydroxyisobutyrate dehydrogenase-like beta-hydroxyacid dehydrogenase
MAAVNPDPAWPAVAVIGAGIMGSAMARNLVDTGLPTTVWDRSAAVTSSLAEAGAAVASSAPEAVTGAHVVITMLPTAAVVNSVIFGDGLADAFPEAACGRRWARSASQRR